MGKDITDFIQPDIDTKFASSVIESMLTKIKNTSAVSQSF